MKQMTKQLLSLALIAGFVPALYADDSSNSGFITPSPFFFTRSQSRNKVLQDVGSIGHTHLEGMDCWWGTFDVVLAYERSFRPGRIVDGLFGLSNTSTLNPLPCNTPCNTTRVCNPCDTGRIFKIQGSQVAGRDVTAWLADYFYLPVDFSSTISFKPHITNTLIFLDSYTGLDDWLCGLYFRIYGPITFSRWNLEFCETIINRGTLPYPAGYFNPGTSNPTNIVFPGCIGEPANNLLSSFSDYAIGLVPQAPTIKGDGIVLQPLKFAKLRKDSHKRSGFADLRFELGWDFWQTPCYHIGFNVQAAAPTGSRIEAEFIFDPVVGNGRHWELGGGLTGHYTFWMNASEDQSFSFWVDANLTHLFKTRQQRTFDLRNKPDSRYMLAERLGTPVVGLFANAAPAIVGVAPAGGVAPALQFKGEFAPVANLTTTDVKVSIGVQADIVAWFNYSMCNWSFDLGYNFWGTTCEKIRLDACDTQCDNLNSICNPANANTWALKGDARVFGFAFGTSTPVALSATENCALITGGTNESSAFFVPTDPFYNANFGVDSAQFAQTTAIGGVLGTAIVVGPLGCPGATTQIKTSLNPITLACCDIDFTRHQGLTHKVFGHASYTWDYECWIPYFGVGASGEWAQRPRNNCDNDCNTNTNCNTSCNTNTSCNNVCETNGRCVRNAASLWSVWVKGGISFN